LRLAGARLPAGVLPRTRRLPAARRVFQRTVAGCRAAIARVVEPILHTVPRSTIGSIASAVARVIIAQIVHTILNPAAGLVQPIIRAVPQAVSAVPQAIGAVAHRVAEVAQIGLQLIDHLVVEDLRQIVDEFRRREVGQHVRVKHRQLSKLLSGQIERNLVARDDLQGVEWHRKALVPFRADGEHQVSAGAQDEVADRAHVFVAPNRNLSIHQL
jgi:hypothetical protein